MCALYAIIERVVGAKINCVAERSRKRYGSEIRPQNSRFIRSNLNTPPPLAACTPSRRETFLLRDKQAYRVVCQRGTDLMAVPENQLKIWAQPGTVQGRRIPTPPFATPWDDTSGLETFDTGRICSALTGTTPISGARVMSMSSWS